MDRKKEQTIFILYSKLGLRPMFQANTYFRNDEVGEHGVDTQYNHGQVTSLNNQGRN